MAMPGAGKGSTGKGSAGANASSGPFPMPSWLSPQSPLLNPNATLSGNSLFQSAQSLANLQTQGPLTELAKEIAANNSQGQAAEKLTSGYYNNLENYVNQGVRDERGIAQGLNHQLRNIGGNEMGALRGVEGNATNSLLHYMPGGRAEARPALGALTQEIARQRGFANQDNASFRREGALQGANYRGLAASNLGSFAMQGEQSLGDIARATQLENLPLNAKQAALNQEGGALLASDLGKLRQQEITNKFTSKGLNIRQQLANTAQFNANTSRSASQSLASFRTASLAQSSADSAWNHALSLLKLGAGGSGGGGGGGLTQSRQDSILNGYDKIAGLYNYYLANGGGKNNPSLKPGDNAGALQAVQSRYGQDAAGIAVGIANGQISQQMWDTLQAHGFTQVPPGVTVVPNSQWLGF